MTRSHRVVGLEYLGLVTSLLQRIRSTRPDTGGWEAADLQWWWRRDQHHHPGRQVFWLDDGGPAAAAVLTEWRDGWGCDLFAIDATVDADVVWQEALDIVARAVPDGDRVEMTVFDDPVFAPARRSGALLATDETLVSTWMSSSERPEVLRLDPAFRLVSRRDSAPQPHHLAARSGDHVADRLAECSLYRPDLDLAVLAPDGTVASYGVFWADPVTQVGLVEPVRTESDFQGRGLARHVIAAGLDRLARLGCTRLKVNYLDGNDAAERLYLGSGFRERSRARTSLVRHDGLGASE